MKVEILAGGGIKTAFKELGIEATKTYHGNKEPYYQVWELEKSDMHKMEEVEEWPDHWGWWRYAKGSNMGAAYSTFKINGHEIFAWDGRSRDDLRNDWYDEPDEEKEAYHYSYREYEEIHMPHKYSNLLDYFSEEIGASLESNLCALAVDLAKWNEMSMARLFETLQG